MTQTLFIRDAGELREASASEVLGRAASLLAERFRCGAPVLAAPELTHAYLRHEVGTLPYEVFGVLLLDRQRRLIRAEVLFRGTIDRCAVHPREVARVVVASDAAAVILFRNDPAEAAQPREADELVARRIRDALALIDVRVLDYLMVGGVSEYSFAEAGRL